MSILNIYFWLSVQCEETLEDWILQQREKPSIPSCLATGGKFFHQMLSFNIACSVYLSPPYTPWKLVSLMSASLAGANKYYIGALALIMKPLIKCTLLSLTQVVASGMTWQQHPHLMTDCTRYFSNQCDIYYSIRRWKWFTKTSQSLIHCH